MILAICMPLMVRANENIQQAGEIVFCDATFSLDRFNTSMFIIWTSTPSSGVPLGVMVMSDEQQSSINKGLEMLADVLPQKAFFGNGARQGPTIVMTDDSCSGSASHSVLLVLNWFKSVVFLCTFCIVPSLLPSSKYAIIQILNLEL